VPLYVEQAYLELTDPGLASKTKRTKSKLFPNTAQWPKRPVTNDSTSKQIKSVGKASKDPARAKVDEVDE